MNIFLKTVLASTTALALSSMTFASTHITSPPIDITQTQEIFGSAMPKENSTKAEKSDEKVNELSGTEEEGSHSQTNKKTEKQSSQKTHHKHEKKKEMSPEKLQKKADKLGISVEEFTVQNAEKCER